MLFRSTHASGTVRIACCICCSYCVNSFDHIQIMEVLEDMKLQVIIDDANLIEELIIRPIEEWPMEKK